LFDEGFVMRSGAIVLLRDVTAEVAHYADRFESVRHRGLRQAFQALNPGLLICHPDTFHVRYANAAAREILELADAAFPCRLPDALTMTRQEEYCEAEGRYVACYQTSIDNGTHDVRAFPVYASGSSNQVDSVLVVIRSYDDVSWSLFEMLDKLPIAVSSLGDDGDVRYINRRALTEIYTLYKQRALRRGTPATADTLLAETLAGFLGQAPESGEGCTEVQVGRSKVDMHFARLGEADNSRLLYWDSRHTGSTWH
jgi:PAS domain-containing protein